MILLARGASEKYEVLAWGNARRMACHRDQIAMAADVDAQHGIAGVRIVIGDPFHYAGQRLAIGRR